MSHARPTTERLLNRLSVGLLALGVGLLIGATPGVAHAAPASDTATATATATQAPSDSAPPASSASPTAPTAAQTSSSASNSSSSSATTTSSPSPHKPAADFPGMMPPDSPDAPPAGVAAGAQAATAAAVAMPGGIDTSHYQHTSATAPIDWGQVAASGQSFAVMKATQGNYFADPWMQRDMDAAHAAGLVVGAYHFADPSISAAAQADYFANAIRSMPMPSLPPVLDLEDNGGLDPASLVNWTAAFLQRVQADTGRAPMIYSGPSFWKNSMGGSTAFTQYPLWEAHYTYDTAVSPAAMGGWSTYALWQWSNQGSVAGITGTVDLDVFNQSTGADLRNLTAPVGAVDSVALANDGNLTVSGWAFDPDTPMAADTVHVYVDGVGHPLTANGSRPDIGSAFPSAGSLHGYSATFQVGPGTHTACIYAIDTSISSQNKFFGCRTQTLVPSMPLGAFESAQLAGDGIVTVSGWAFDPDSPTTATTVHVYIDGVGQALTANDSRPDIGAAFPAAGNLHGFGLSTQLTPGSHTVCVYGIDNYFANLHSTLGCRSLTYVPNLPTGVLEATQLAGNGTLTVSGWAFDTDTPTTASTVHVYIDGVGQAITANDSRPDIGAAFPAAGDLHGFGLSTPLTPGRHTVCVYGIDTTFAYLHSTLGCRTLTYVPNLPIGMLEATQVSAADGTVTVSGWAFDPDTPTTASTVHVYVDNQGQAITASDSRPDIGAAFPAAGNLHGFSTTAALTPGGHTVCVYAIDTAFTYEHTNLGCHTVLILPNRPIGMLESAQVAGDGTLSVSGWAFDPDTPTTASTVHVYIDGVGHPITAGGSRPDVGAVFPAAGNLHGFSTTAALAPGTHTVCVYAIDTTYWSLNTPLGCRTVTH